MKEIEVRTYSDFVNFLFDWKINGDTLKFTRNDGTTYIMDDPQREEDPLKEDDPYELFQALFAENFLREVMYEDDPEDFDDGSIHEISTNELILSYRQRYYPNVHTPEPVKYIFIFD